MREVVRHGFTYGAAALTLAVIDLLSTPFLTRLFGPGDYGTRELIVNAVAFITPFTLAGFDFAFPSSYLAERARGRGTLFVSTTLLSVAGWSTVLTIAVAIIDVAFVQWPNPKETISFAVAALVAAPGAVFLLAKWSLRFRFSPRRYAFVAATGGALATGFGLVGAVLIHDLLGFFVGQLIGAAAGAAIGLATIRDEVRPVFDVALLRQSLRLGLPFTPATVLTLAFLYVDRQVLGSLLGVSAVGIYALGWRVALVPALLVSVLNTLWLPIALRDSVRPEVFRPLLADALRYACILLGFVAVVLGAAAPEIVRVLAPQDFAGAAEVVGTLALAASFQAIAALLGAGIFIARRPALGLIANATALVTNAAVGIIAVPVLGPLGAAVGVVSGYAVLAGAYVLLLRHATPLKSLPLRPLAGVLAIAIAALVVASRAVDAPAVRSALPVAYIAAMFITRSMDLRDLARVPMIFRSRQ